MLMAPVVEKTVFCILVLLHVAAMICAQDDQSGFISIDCGSGSNYTQDGTGIRYVSDDGFIEGGVIHDISLIHNYSERVYNTLRSFPENKQNCYTLRPQQGKNHKYLIRARFFYGNTRGQPPQFDLHIGADYWVTVYISNPTTYVAHELIHHSSSDYINVCLVNTASGYPFITSLELRPLDSTIYNDQPRSLFLSHRRNFGTDETVRYKDDKYDRIWDPIESPGYRAIQTSDTDSLTPVNEEQVPLEVMRSAITPINSTDSVFYWWNSAKTTNEFNIYVYLAEVEVLEGNQKREVDVKVNDIQIGTYLLSINITTIKKNISDGSTRYKLTVERTVNSTLPPILNAIEVYTLRQLLQNQTDDQDAAAIWSTKSSYGLTKLNWQGDPCVPEAWVGLNCNYNDQGVAKIISLNLSSRGLSGEIDIALAGLTMIESLDLSYNNLTGNVPEFLAKLDNLKILNLKGNNFTRPLPAELVAKSKKGLLSLSTDESSGDQDRSSCVAGSCRNNKHKTVVIVAPIIGCMVVLSIIIIFLVKKLKRKALTKRGEFFTHRKQQFTYSEVVGMTNNFKNEIGKGGFGSVFRGSVEDNQVAVKMLSESSSQGYKEFLAEVKLLMEIHHTNITSLVGYCNDRNHKAIIYEFMPNGNLEKHLFDGYPNVLTWERRLQIGCDAAEGLAYLHHGCRPPIVHRDVKSSNILLNEGFKAKLADFGLSRAFPTEGASHVSSLNVMGTVGYLDPEYYSTYRLTEKSDVYSFGVVLLELITGRKAISDDIYIVNWVKSAVEEGNVEKIIDSRLEGRFDINTAWKVVETAIACVSPTSIKRPTMNNVVTDLKHCVQTEIIRPSESMSLKLESVRNPNPR